MPYQVIRKFTDVQADFPADGIIAPDVTTILIVTPAGVTCDIYATLDVPDDIRAGTAEFYLWESVAAGSSKFFVWEYGPTGYKLQPSGAGVKAWFKS